MLEYISFKLRMVFKAITFNDMFIVASNELTFDMYLLVYCLN